MSERSERPMRHGSVALGAADGQGEAAARIVRRRGVRNGARR
ncbi:hypothetical protein OOJ91_09685 [Micromonospora lupini]|nr:hypothetical protein [Micromonospora lupini]MCX5066148.1 hypothetical protein [Micromonospora lupini]